MRWVVLMLLVPAAAARAQEPPPPSVVVVADVVQAPRAGRRCRVTLRIVTAPAEAGLRAGDTVDASISCYLSTLQQLHRPGRFRFRLDGDPQALRARPVGGRIPHRARTVR